MPQPPSFVERLQTGAADFLTQLRDYLGIGGKVRREPIRDRQALQTFIDSRASFIAQTSLYGYLRTRAGMRYPELFDDDPFVVSINIAKWHLWLACLSDLSVYAGGLMARRGHLPDPQVAALMEGLVGAILTDTGIPEDADAGFAAHAERVRARLAMTPWHQVEDGEGCFHESPTALVKWAPVVDSFKKLDEEIVRNSVRYHWKEVRQELREYLDATAVAASAAR